MDAGDNLGKLFLILKGNTVDVVYTWKYGGPQILNTVYKNEMKW